MPGIELLGQLKILYEVFFDIVGGIALKVLTDTFVDCNKRYSAAAQSWRATRHYRGGGM